ncbi:MAG: TRAP transporter substrate-binding protein, partial [Cyclobacteriaceae bacterium]
MIRIFLFYNLIYLMNKMMKRRKFLSKAITTTTMVGAGGALLSCADNGEKKTSPEAVNINFNKNYRWNMVTTWPPNFPVVGEGCIMMAQWIEKMSGGRLKINVNGGGELIPPLECFDAVSNGAVEMGHGVAYYWAGKVPAAQFFGAVPFGMNANQSYSWIISGEGGKLWEEIYEPFDLLPITCGNTGVQMGGWFNRDINSVADLKGLKMRIPGLGGKVFNKAGGTAVLVSGNEVYTNLERGVIDATEWIGPYHDYKMGFYEVAKNYYYPGWHEPGATLELLINKTKLAELPSDLRQIVKTAAYRLNHWMGAEFDAKNAVYLNKLVNEEGVRLKEFPSEVLKTFHFHTQEAIAELTDKDPTSKKVYNSYSRFRESLQTWSSIS